LSLQWKVPGHILTLTIAQVHRHSCRYGLLFAKHGANLCISGKRSFRRSDRFVPKRWGAPLTAYDVIFTSNTTEAINLAAESLSHEPEQDTEPVVLNSLLEHSSNDLPWRTISGSSVIRLSIDAEGFVDLNELETLLCAYNKTVSMEETNQACCD